MRPLKDTKMNELNGQEILKMPSEKTHTENSTKTTKSSHLKVIYTNECAINLENEEVDLDDIDVNDGYDGDNDDDELNQVVVDEAMEMNGKKDMMMVGASASNETPNKANANKLGKTKSIEMMNNHSDTASSSESGFGTVDDDIENHSAASSNNNNNNSNKQQSQSGVEIGISKCELAQQANNQSPESAGQSVGNNPSLGQSSISRQFPILQPPRQIIYELSKNGGNSNTNNTNNADDVINILNDNSSINSSISSSNSSLTNCCSSMVERLTKFYYSCFCCYSTTSHTNQTPCIFSWLSIFCCCCPLLGGISLYLTHRSKKFKLKQKYDLAEKYSNYAEKLNIASLIFGVIFYAIAFFYDHTCYIYVLEA